MKEASRIWWSRSTDEDAPLAIGATATPAAVTTMVSSAKAPALMPILLFIVNPHLLFDSPPRGLVTYFSSVTPGSDLVLDIVDYRMTLL